MANLFQKQDFVVIGEWGISNRRYSFNDNDE